MEFISTMQTSYTRSVASGKILSPSCSKSTRSASSHKRVVGQRGVVNVACLVSDLEIDQSLSSVSFLMALGITRARVLSKSAAENAEIPRATYFVSQRLGNEGDTCDRTWPSEAGAGRMVNVGLEPL